MTPEEQTHYDSLSIALAVHKGNLARESKGQMTSREVDSCQNVHLEIQTLRTMLIERKPLPHGVALDCFIDSAGWCRLPAFRELFAEYVAQGYIDVNATYTAKGRLTKDKQPYEYLPLEAAATRNSIDTIDSLLELGAQLSLIPSLAFAKFGYTCIDDIVAAYWPNVGDDVGVTLMAAITAGGMRQRIASSSSATTEMQPNDEPVSGAPAKRRRMGV
jgi:hypothetical protein